MKKLIISCLLLAGILFFPSKSFSQINDLSPNNEFTPKGGDVLLKSFKDSVAYSYGTMIAKQMIDEGIDMNMLVKGLEHTFEKTPLLTVEQSKLCVKKNQLKKKEERKQIELARVQAGEIFLKQNRDLPGVGSTPSGLQYKILKKGNGKRPTVTDKVLVHYEGKFLNNELFDSTILKDPVEFKMTNVVKGWQEGLQLMEVGSQYQFYIPAKLAYGSRGYNKIPPGALTIFTVELLEVKKVEEPTKETKEKK